MEKRSALLLSVIVLCFFALAGVGITRLMRDSAPQSEKQLTQQQRLKALDTLSPTSDAVRRVVAGESARREVQEDISEPGQ